MVERRRCNFCGGDIEPGTGLMFIQSVDFVDVPIMAAYLCFVALLFVVINLFVDILYFIVDPRIRLHNS